MCLYHQFLRLLNRLVDVLEDAIKRDLATYIRLVLAHVPVALKRLLDVNFDGVMVAVLFNY